MTVVTADINEWNLLQAKAQEARIVLAFNAFRSQGIEPILIKGWAAARNYPPNHTRRGGDIDLAVAPAEHEHAAKLLKNPEIGRHLVDLHQGLRQLDSVEWGDLFYNSILVDLNGSKIRILRPEDHLRVLCIHWLIDGGGYKDKLWDIYFAVENRSKDFDWNRCLDVVDGNRKRWIVCAIALAHRYLELEISDLPFADDLRKIPGWITNCLEREWRMERLEPVVTSVHDKKLLFRQITRRIPPNPIRATIEANGDLYGSRRWWYQAVVVGRRLGPLLRQIISLATLKFRRSED
jgi:hypothetical protein